MKAYDAEEALQVMAKESRNETKSNKPVSLPRVASVSRSDTMCDIYCDFIPHRGQYNGWSVKAYDAEEALQVMAKESRNETKSNQPVSLPELHQYLAVIPCMTYAVTLSPTEVT